MEVKRKEFKGTVLSVGSELVPKENNKHYLLCLVKIAVKGEEHTVQAQYTMKKGGLTPIVGEKVTLYHTRLAATSGTGFRDFFEVGLSTSTAALSALLGLDKEEVATQEEVATKEEGEMKGETAATN